MTHASLRRFAAALAAAGLIAGALTACAGGAGASEESGGPADGHFPVTVHSALGDARIPAKPKRVVTIGWGSADTAIALDTVPVGMEKITWGGDADGYAPWVREAIEEKDAKLPAVFDVYPEIDVEAIVKLHPDLILAPQSGLTKKQYATLSELAPTVAYPKGPWVTGWQEEITVVGKALGRPEKAADLIAGLKKRLADAAAAHPDFASLSFAYIYAVEPGKLAVYTDADQRVQILTALGLKEDKAVAEVKATQGYYAMIGLERADILKNADIVFTWFNDKANEKQIEAQPLYASIPAVKRGSYVALTDQQLASASSAITPLSVPWALDRFLPLIEKAAAKVE